MNMDNDNMNEELELTDEQVERMDELDNAAHEYLKVVTNNPELPWNQEYIGNLNDSAADLMYHKGFKIYYPAIVTDAEGNQQREDFYEPDEPVNGVIKDGAYFCEKLFGKCPEVIEDFSKFMPKITCYDSGKMSIWAHNEAEAGEVASYLTKEDICRYRTFERVGIRAEFEQPEDRLVSVILRDQDGLNVRISELIIRTWLSDDEIIPAIMAASKDYLNTPEGREVWEHNCHNFNFGDFDTNVSNKFCTPHGFYRVDQEMDSSMEVDFNTQLATPENSNGIVYEIKLENETVKVTGEDIDDIMESAMTGCTYWCSHADVVGEYLGEYASEQISHGGSIIFYDMEDERSSSELTRDKFLEGLRMLFEAQNGIHTLMVEERDGSIYVNPGMIDADAADSVIQYALFGEIIYA